MKIKIIKNLFKISLFIFLITSNVFSQEIKFEAEQIDSFDNEIIKASKNIVITDSLGNKIFGEKLILNKKTKILDLSKNVIVEDIKNSITIETKRIKYDQIKNIIYTFDKTIINYKELYEIETSDISFNRDKGVLSSNNKTSFLDTDKNTLNMEGFEIFLEKDALITSNVKLIDKELNIYNIKEAYYDFKRKKILGKNVIVNKENKLSKQRYLPRIKSNSIIFENGNSKFNKTVYTSCKKREGCPPWLIQAEEVTHNKKNKLVNYKNAILKFYDIPVLYFPKFYHPDPTVERQSGFLTPNIDANNSNSFISLPYFFAISDNSDFTLSPRFYDNQKSIYQGEYRLEKEKSSHIMDASIKNNKTFVNEGGSTQTHIFSNSKIITNFEYFDFSQVNVKIQNTSNKNYLKSYNIKSPIIDSTSTLNSRFEFEGYSGDLDFSVSTEVYEDLSKENDSDKYEHILPNFSLSKSIDTDLGGSLSFASNGYNKLFDTNVSEKVFINNFSYKSMQSTTNIGFINNFEFLIKNLNAKSKNSKTFKNKTENDIQGIFQFNSKLPLKKEGANYNSLLTPIIVGKINPLKNRNIKNIDRFIDYNNIYSINRIGSNETLEGDASFTFGNEFKILNKANSNEIFGINLATSIRNKKNEDLPISSSLGQKTSNIVGQSNYNFNDNFKIDYNFLLDNNLGQFNYHKIKSSFQVNNFVTSFEFAEENNEIGNESFISNTTSYDLNDNSQFTFRTRKNKKTNLTEFYNLVYQYKMDCLTAGVEYKKNYYNDGDIKPQESLFFSITLMPFGSSVGLPGVN